MNKDNVTERFRDMYIKIMYNRFLALSKVDLHNKLSLPHEPCIIPSTEFESICDTLDQISLGKSEVIMNTALCKSASKFYAKLVLFLGVDGEPIRAMGIEYHMYPVIMLDGYVYDFILHINAAPIGEYIDFLLAFNENIRMSTEYGWMPYADDLPGLITWSMYQQLTSTSGLSFNYTLSQRKVSA